MGGPRREELDWMLHLKQEFRSSGVQEFQEFKFRSQEFREFRSSGVQECGVQEFRSSGVQEFRISGVQEFGVHEFQEFRSSGAIDVEK